MFVQEKTGHRGSTGGYYWLPVPGQHATHWAVLTCHTLGHDAHTGHVDLWPSAIDRLSECWHKDPRALRKRLRDRYTSLPRGRVTRHRNRTLILHGDDAPVDDWAAMVIPAFDLDHRSVRVLFDQHERMLPDDRVSLEEILAGR